MTRSRRRPWSVLSFAQRLERSSIVVAALCFALICWLYYHFFTKKLSLDINSVNTIILLLGLLLHRNVARFTTALREAIVSSWPIVVMYHLYAGVAGLIQYHFGRRIPGRVGQPHHRPNTHFLC